MPPTEITPAADERSLLTARATSTSQALAGGVRAPGRVVALSLGAVALGSLSGCAPAIVRSGGYCAPPSAEAFGIRPDPPPPPGAPREAQTAALLGLSGVTAEQASRATDVRLRVLERITLASLAIDATSAELDCEGERADQAGDYLTRGQTSTVQALTVASVAAATVTSIAGVLLSTNNRPNAEQDSVAIGGGVVTAALGLGSLFVHPRTAFAHSRNLLADVWLGPAVSATYPPLVWTYLTRSEFSNAQRTAIRERIVARWKLFDQVEDPATAAILFGAGGSYDADTLHARAAMLDEVKAEVDLAHQELAALAAVLLRDEPPRAVAP